MTPEEGTGDCIRTTGSMTWEAIWETFRAGAHVVGVGYLSARGMLLILINNYFLTMSISPQGIVETHALLEDFLLLNQLPGAIFLYMTHSFIVVNKNINKDEVALTTGWSNGCLLSVPNFSSLASLKVL